MRLSIRLIERRNLCAVEQTQLLGCCTWTLDACRVLRSQTITELRPSRRLKDELRIKSILSWLPQDDLCVACVYIIRRAPEFSELC